ncbi:MAG: hypothetical protein ABFS35_12035 [Bacteroidota bacterium]
MKYLINKYLTTLISILIFQNNSLAQTVEYNRPGLSLQFTALEYTGSYHFPTNNSMFDPSIQYSVNNGQLEIYRDYLKKVIVVNEKPGSVNAIRNTGLLLSNILNIELGTWSSLSKSKKRKRKQAVLKYREIGKVGGLKKNSIYILTYNDFIASKKLRKLAEADLDGSERYLIKDQLEIMLASADSVENSVLDGDTIKRILSGPDSYFYKFIKGNIFLVGSNHRSTLYGAFDIISEVERQKRIDEIEKEVRILPSCRLANLWSGVNANESNAFLSKKSLFYNILNSGNHSNRQFAYEKLAQMLAFYNINGVVLEASYDCFNSKQNHLIKLFTNKMEQYGIGVFVEVSSTYAENNQKLIDDFFSKNNNLIKGLVINSTNLYNKKEISGGSAVANLVAGKGYKVIWRDEQEELSEEEKSERGVIFKNLDTKKLDASVIKESISINPKEFKDGRFCPASIIDNKLIKSYVFHWKGKNPYDEHVFSDEKADIAFMVYFYTEESKDIVQIIDKKIGKVQP